MYFSNITNSELVKYHNTIKNNFELPFSEMISSSLFKVETIISNKLYKVYPLFYCEKITSTNPNDEIMENKCIICQYNNHTLFSFITSKNCEGIGRFSIEVTYVGVVFYIYDEITDANIPNARITGIIINRGTSKTFSFDGFTDENGVYYISWGTNWSNPDFTNLDITLDDGTNLIHIGGS